MIRRLLRSLVAVGLVVFNLMASEQHGEVTFGGLPVPGATVTATQGEKKSTAVTDPQGAYSFPDLADGVWTIQMEMLGFAPVKDEITAGQGNEARHVGTENVAARSDPRGSSVGRRPPNPPQRPPPAPGEPKKPEGPRPPAKQNRRATKPPNGPPMAF